MRIGVLRGMLAGVLLVSFAGHVHAAPTTAPSTRPTAASGPMASEESVRKLMDLLGAGKLGTQVMQQMITAMRTSHPDLPAQFWDDFQKSMDADHLIALIIPIYQKHLTEEDVLAILQFYQSPAGQHFIAHQTQIMQESMQAGQAWGQEIGSAVIKRIQEKGHAK